MDKFFNLSTPLTEDKIIARQHRIYADTFYSDGVNFNPITTKSFAPKLKIKFFLDAVLFTDPNLEDNDPEKKKTYQIGKYFEIEPGETITLNNTHFPNILEQPFKFLYECTENDGSGNFTWRLTPTKDEYTLYMSSIVFEDSYYNNVTGWYNPDNEDNLINVTESEAIDPVPLPYEYLRKYGDSLIVDGTESYSFDTTSIADYLRCRIFLDVIRLEIPDENAEPDDEPVYKYYKVGRWFNLENLQSVQFNNTHFLEIDDQRFSFQFEITKNNGNGQFIWKITIDKPNYALYFSNIVFEDSVYDSTKGWLASNNPDNVISLLESDAIDSYQPLYRKVEDAIILSSTVDYTYASKSKADFLKCKFFLDAVKYTDPDLENDDENKIRYFRVGKYFEIENEEKIQLNNSHIFDPNFQAFTLTYTCTKNDGNGNFKWNITLDKPEYEVYISNVILQESLYDNEKGWLNPNNPDNIIDLINVQSLDAVDHIGGGGDGYPPDEKTIVFTTDGKLTVPIDNLTIIYDEDTKKIKSTVDGTQTVYTANFANDGSTKNIVYDEGGFSIRIGFIAAGNLIIYATFANDTDISTRTISNGGTNVTFDRFEAGVEKSITMGTGWQNNINTWLNVVDRFNNQAYEITFSTIGYTNGSYPVSFAITVEPYGEIDPNDITRFSRSGRILKIGGGGGYEPDERTIKLDALNRLTVPIDNASIIVSTDDKVAVEPSAIIDNNTIVVNRSGKLESKPRVLDYSTVEQDTGRKWIDGKTIYSRVIDGKGSNLTATPFNSLPLISTLVTAVSTTYLPSPAGFRLTSSMYIDLDYYVIIQLLSTGKILFTHGALSPVKTVILEYTKR